METIAIANLKGGVLKTTTAVTLGHGLALAGWRVLLVDLDHQGHAAVSLGLEKSPGFHTLITQENLPLDQIVVNARENLDIIPNDKSMADAKDLLAAKRFRERFLANRLKPASAQYDALIFDMAPSFDLIHTAALLTSSYVLIPAKLDHLAIDGINEMLREMAILSDEGYGFKGFFVLPTLFDRTTRETAERLSELLEVFGDVVWPVVPTDTRAREAARLGQTIWEYSPSSAAINGYNIDGEQFGGYEQILQQLAMVISQ